MLRTLFLILFCVTAPSGLAAADPPDTARVDPAASCIATLLDESAALSLPVRVERAFTLTLHAADDALRHRENGRAIVLLRTFTFEVRGVKRAKRLEPETADMLIAKAEEAITHLTFFDRERAK
jgi:hypothetical protein